MKKTNEVKIMMIMKVIIISLAMDIYQTISKPLTVILKKSLHFEFDRKNTYETTTRTTKFLSAAISTDPPQHTIYFSSVRPKCDPHFILVVKLI